VWSTLSFIELTKRQQQATRGGKQHSKLATGNLDFGFGQRYFRTRIKHLANAVASAATALGHGHGQD